MKRRKINGTDDNIIQMPKKNSKHFNSHSFKPGQVGNPKGRPLVPTEYMQLMRDYSVEAALKLMEWARSDHPKAGPAACMYIINRAYGMPVQATEISGPHGAPLDPPSINVMFATAAPRLENEAHQRKIIDAT